MIHEKDREGNLLPGEHKLTKIVEIVRVSTIDELLNFFKGDMSLIGPRCLLLEYLSLHNVTQKRRY